MPLQDLMEILDEAGAVRTEGSAQEDPDRAALAGIVSAIADLFRSRPKRLRLPAPVPCAGCGSISWS